MNVLDHVHAHAAERARGTCPAVTLRTPDGGGPARDHADGRMRSLGARDGFALRGPPIQRDVS
jgi:hypothetical protein